MATVAGGPVPGGAVPGGAVPGGAVPGGAVPGGAVPGGGGPHRAATGALAGALAASYRLCRQVNRTHGRSYYLATLLLPPAKRRHVHALYAFARHADDIVDAADGGDVSRRTRRLAGWGQRLFGALDGASAADPLLPAVVDTINRLGLDRGDFVAFLRSMAMDLTITSYPTYRDLLSYMEGSAAVIGTMVLPVLEPSDPARAREPARQLGLAFQMTNFIRDVAEDLDRGRIYLPRSDLDRFGVSEPMLRAAVDEGRRAAGGGRLDRRVRALIAFEVGRARGHYRAAARGLALLPPASRACARAAYRIYGGILDEIVARDYDVFTARAVVPTRRRLALAAGCLLARRGAPVPLPGRDSGRATLIGPELCG